MQEESFSLHARLVTVRCHFHPTPVRVFLFSFLKSLSLLHRTAPPLHRFSISPKHPQTPLRSFFPHTHRPAPHTPLLHVFPPTGPETPKPLPTRNPNPNPSPSPSPAPAPSHTNTWTQLFLLSLLNPRTPPHSQFHNLT